MVEGNLPELSRRGFLGAAAAASAIIVVGPQLAEAIQSPAAGGPLRIMLRRREDMLRVDVSLYNMQRGTRGVGAARFPVFEPTGGLLSNSYLVADLGPQHLIEEAYNNGGGRHALSDARLSGTSRLAFKNFSATLASVPGLLAWNLGRASVQNVGQATQGGIINYNKQPPHMPTATETSIEMPFMLILNPHSESAWRHALLPVTHDGRTEAWHTRLAWQDNQLPTPIPREDEGPWNFDIFTVRAVWLRDSDGQWLIDNVGQSGAQIGAEGYPFNSLPGPRDRADLVRLSTMTQGNPHGAIKGGAATAIPARLSLSPMGGTMRVNGIWNAPDVSSLELWQQRTWQGRDTFIRIVRSGYLFPWGFKAAIDQQIQRRFLSAANGDIRPFLVRTAKIVIKDPNVDLTGHGAPYAGRGTPFTSIRCLTKQTPELANPAENDLYIPLVQTSINGGVAPAMFDLIATDWEGRETSFSMPLFFAQYFQDRHDGIESVIERNDGHGYNQLPAGQRTAAIHDDIAFAGAVQSGTTRFPTNTMTFLLQPPTNAAGIDRFAIAAFPLLESADIVAEGVSRISGTSTPSVVEFPEAYLHNGFVGNATGVFLKSTTNAAAVSMGAKAAGGLITPSFALAGFSRTVGPILGSPDQIADLAASATIQRGAVDAANPITDMFGDIKLLGGVTLADILGSELDLLSSDGMKIVTTNSGNVSTTKLTWDKRLDTIVGSVADEILDTTNANLHLEATTVVDVSTGKSTSTMEGSVTDLGIRLIGASPFIGVEVVKLGFSAGSGRDSDIEVDIGDVTFAGALSFLQTLSQYLPTSDSGLSVDVDGQGITAALALALPDIAVGVFTITGVTMGSKLTIPFGSDPMRFRFNFSEPEDPFGCTVLGIGGAGSFVFLAGLDGIERMEITAQLQAMLALDFGVASGSVRVAVGISFALEQDASGLALLLTAFVRIQGEVKVICIVELAIEVYLGLEFKAPISGSGPVQLTGKASVSVKVSVLFFSGTVSWEIERTIDGPDQEAPPSYMGGPAASVSGVRSRRARTGISGAGTSFGDSMSSQDWTSWCGAFA